MASVFVASLAGGTVAYSPTASKSREFIKYTIEIYTLPSFFAAKLTSALPNWLLAIPIILLSQLDKLVIPKPCTYVTLC